MNHNHFDFKDLMACGMFILALLTFVFTFIRSCIRWYQISVGVVPIVPVRKRELQRETSGI